MPEEEKKVDIAAETDEEKQKREADEARKAELEKEVVKEGDMILVDILGKTIEEDETRNMVFQASNTEDAKLLPNYDPKKAGQYTNELVIVGKKGFVEDKIDEVLQSGIKFFEEKTIELEPADAFGVREGSKIEKVSEKQYKKDMKGERPYPGAPYDDKKGRHGTILRAAQGRCLVDFNHPLAGRKVSYRVKVTDRIEGFDNRAKALLARRLGNQMAMADLFVISHDKDSKTLEVEIPQMLVFQLAQQQGGIYFKMGASMDMQENLDYVDTVKFVEVYAKPPAPTPADEIKDAEVVSEKEE